MIKLIGVLIIILVTICILGAIELYDKKQRKTQNKRLDYRLQKIKIHHIVCEICNKALVDNDAVISFNDEENKLHTSHATCCFIVDEEKQIATNYYGEQIPKEDLPKHGVMIGDDDKKKIEEFIK
jgi:hypothetical protein